MYTCQWGGISFNNLSIHELKFIQFKNTVLSKVDLAQIEADMTDLQTKVDTLAFMT